MATHDPTTGNGLKIVDFRGADSPSRRAVDDPARDRMLASTLKSSGEGKHFLLAPGSDDKNAVQCWVAEGECAGLVEHEGVNLAQRLDGFGIPKKHTELRAASARDHDRDRCGQPQGAGACDNQHRDRIDERISQTRFGSEDPPGYKSEQRDQDDGRDKPSRNSIGQSL